MPSAVIAVEKKKMQNTTAQEKKCKLTTSTFSIVSFLLFMNLTISPTIFRPVQAISTAEGTNKDATCKPIRKDNNEDIEITIGEICVHVVNDHMEVDIHVIAQNCIISESFLCDREFSHSSLAGGSLLSSNGRSYSTVEEINVEDACDVICDLPDKEYLLDGHSAIACDYASEEEAEGDGGGNNIEYKAHYEIGLVCKDGALAPVDEGAGDASEGDGNNRRRARRTIEITTTTSREPDTRYHRKAVYATFSNVVEVHTSGGKGGKGNFPRFSKVQFKNDYLAWKHEDRLPLTSANYPIKGADKIMLQQDSYCISVRNRSDYIPRYDENHVSLNRVLNDLCMYEGPLHPEDGNDYWLELDYVVRMQLVRQQCGSYVLASDLWKTPIIWQGMTLMDVSQAVRDEYPGLWTSGKIVTLFGDLFPAFEPEYEIDATVIKDKSRAGFSRGIVMLAQINTWAHSVVAQHVYTTKWTHGRARPEEVAYNIKRGVLGTYDGVPDYVIDNIQKLQDFDHPSKFTAYEKEGATASPSWPSMHGAGSSCSLWMPVVLNMSDEQREDVRSLDYSISYARVLAGVSHVTDHIDGLRMGQEIVAQLLPDYLNQMYGSDPDVVRRKVEAERFSWFEYDHSYESKADVTCP